MELSQEQKTFMELTLMLEKKTKEFKSLCKKLEKIENSKAQIKENELLSLKQEFEKNNKEIKVLKEQLSKLNLKK